MRDLGAKVGLSGPAVTERVRRLEERGVVRSYRAEVAPERIGLPVVAFVSLGMSYDVRPSNRLEGEVQAIDEVVECYRITGEDAYLLKVAVADMEALRETLDRLSELTSALRRWAVSLDVSANLLIIRTPPGHANALARAIDEARLPDVLGTVAGDDTIMVIAREGVQGAAVERELQHHLEGDT